MNSQQAQGVQIPAQAVSGAGSSLRALVARLARKRLLVVALAAVAVVAVAPFLVPASVMVPRVEKLASEALQEPVRIGAAQLFLLPWPHVTMREITVGRKAELDIGRLSITPRIFSLFGNHKTLRSIELSRVRVRQALFDRVERWSSGGSGNAPMVQVERISLRDADLKLANASLKGIDADVQLAPGNAVSSMLVLIHGGAVRLSLTPEGEAYAVHLDARNWLVPATGLTIASLKANGRLTNEGLNLPSVEGMLYGGSVAGHLSLSWKADWKLAGQLGLQDVDLKPIAAVYSKKAPISGRLNAATGFDMQAPSAAALAAAPNIAVDFEVEDGVLHGMDLAAAAKLLAGKDEAKPGDTRFDRFSGHLLVDSEGFHFTGLKVASGVLDAGGFVSISPQRELSGQIEAAVKGTGSLVSTPLALSGTVDSPRVLPTKGTLAGAAAGTLLLGPVVGTTIGMKAGQFTERLFGNKTAGPKGTAPPSATGTKTSPPAAEAKPDVDAQPGRR